MWPVVLRYALAPACIVLAVLLHLSPAGPTLNPTGPFVIAVLIAAWFGGAGPGLVAAVLATLTLPQLVAVSYPLLGGFLDLPRFITFSVEGLAVGWGSSRRAGVLRDQERYARAMSASDDGFWDWIVAGDRIYASPRLLEIYGIAPGTNFAGRNDLLAQIPFHPEDRPLLMRAFAEHFTGKTVRYDVETRFIRDGETRWVHLTGMAARDRSGAVVRWTGTVRDVTERKRAELALRQSEERYALAMAASESGYWDWDIPTGRYFVSSRANLLAGLPAENTFADRADFSARISMHPEDWVKWEAARKELFAGTGERLVMECRYIVRGETRWHSLQGICKRDDAGKVARWTGSATDITERKQAEEALRRSKEELQLAMESVSESEARFRALTALSSDWYWEQDQNLRFTYLSNQAMQLTGYSGESSLGKTRWEIENMTPLSCSWAEHQAVLAARQPFRDLECRRVGPDGTVRYLSMSGAPIFDAQGGFRGYRGIGRNITERKRAEEALRGSEERYERVVAATQAGFWDWDVVQDRYYVSPRLLEMAGLPPGTIIAGRADFQSRVPIHPEDLEQWQQAMKALFESGGSRLSTELRVTLGAETRWYRLDGMCFRDAAGRVVRWTGSAIDVTPRKLAEEALRASEARKSAMFETALDCIVSIDHEGRVVEFNPAAERTFGYRRADALGKELAELIIPPRLRAQHRQGLARYLKSGEGAVLGRRTEMPAVRADGAEFPVELSVTRIATQGAPLFTAYLRDITARKRIEEALRQSEERYALAVAGSNEGIFDWDLVSDRVYVSYRAQELFGLPRGELWRPRRDWRHILTFHPDDAPRLHDSIKAHIEGGTPTYDMEFRIVLPGGGVRWFRQRGIALRDASGKAYRVVGSIGDVTERHEVEEELGSLERKLRQAQRLEAMGTLAGGIAHDFNNILGAILGYGEMALRGASKGSRLARDLDSIIVAGERGRALVDRVLAFSRSAVGERVAVHVEKVVREALDLVSAKLPPNIALRAELRAGRSAILGDATQVHQVLMNLATNAVQAMPEGGTLRVSLDVSRADASRVPTVGVLAAASEYLVLRVADTGTGIAPEILERIFDPFFTTKEVGTGTGLGLSLVHGIVADLGGAIDVASIPGAGSTFTVYLPRSGDALDSSREQEVELPRGDGQRVLIVDDEEPLVRLATRALEELGYAPVGFTSSSAALAAFRADPQRFDALITDERMPGMSGSALIREVRGIRGSMPVVLMSGYLRATAGRADAVLQKPLSARDLATSLARVLRP
jgi:PAS domain S-box-containing protein